MTTLSEDALKAFDDLNGHHAGCRPAHAKGILLAGVFTPAANVKMLTCAPHVESAATEVIARFSDFAGIPTIPDNDPGASPRGLAIRFLLGPHVHTDIISHSVDGFPTRTAEEFVEFLRAIRLSGLDSVKPTALDRFMQAHPAAFDFVQTPKPMPVSFAKERYFSVTAYKFTNAEGTERFGRYRIWPETGGPEFLDMKSEATVSTDYLMNEIQERITKKPVTMHIRVQIAANEDVIDDSTVHWSEERTEIEFGSIELRGVVPNNAEEQRHIIFDPIPRVSGIAPSPDPLLEPRAALYLKSGRRRRAEEVK